MCSTIHIRQQILEILETYSDLKHCHKRSVIGYCPVQECRQSGEDTTQHGWLSVTMGREEVLSAMTSQGLKSDGANPQGYDSEHSLLDKLGDTEETLASCNHYLSHIQYRSGKRQTLQVY
jgi:hypothetical protein